MDEPTCTRQPADAASADAFAAALRRRGTTVAGITDGRGRPAPDRFAVYRNNVIHSLAEALAATFPATRRLMGDADFRGAAVAFAEAVKPDSPILFRYGAGFPDFLMRPGHLSPALGECAAIEYARVQAFHAADAAPLDPCRLALAPADLARLVLTPHPAARLVPTPHGGYRVWHGDPHGDVAAALVTRPAMEVLVLPLTTAAATFAARLYAGTPLAEAAAVDDLDLTGVLAALLSGGAFADLPVP